VSKPVSDFLVGDGVSLKEAMEGYEKALIQRSMNKYANQRRVAKVLKVDQATISRKLKKYCIGSSDVFLHKAM
jgi:TyrR family helix-turn-helix protein